MKLSDLPVELWLTVLSDWLNVKSVAKTLKLACSCDVEQSKLLRQGILETAINTEFVMDGFTWLPINSAFFSKFVLDERLKKSINSDVLLPFYLQTRFKSITIQACAPNSEVETFLIMVINSSPDLKEIICSDVNADYDKIFTSTNDHILRQMTLINMTIVPENLKNSTLMRIAHKTTLYRFEMKLYVPCSNDLEKQSKKISLQNLMYRIDCVRATMFEMAYTSEISALRAAYSMSKLEMMMM